MLRGTATPTVVAPMEGVTLHLADVLGSLRCGTGPGDVYMYTVVVWAANPGDAASPSSSGEAGGPGEAGEAASPESSTGDAGGSVDAGDAGDTDAGGDSGVGVPGGPIGEPLFSNVFDCFSDAVLDNLGVDGGSMQFFLRVYAYSYEGALLAATGSADGDVSVSSPRSGARAASGPTGRPCQFVQDASTAQDLGAKAQWSATCTATEPIRGTHHRSRARSLEPIEPSSGDAAAEAAPRRGPGPDASGSTSPDRLQRLERLQHRVRLRRFRDSGRQRRGLPDAAGPDSGADSSASDSSAPDASNEGG